MAAKTPLRKALALVATAGLAMTMAACGGSDSGSKASKDDTNWDDHGPITYVQGKDFSNFVQKRIDKWNKEHPDEKVTLIELSDKADEQRQSMVNNATTKGSAGYDVISMDIVWTAEFAANQYVRELPKDKFDTSKYLTSAVDGATYFDKLYAFPQNSDGALLYYRKDLLDKAGLQPPKTWDEMKAACKKIQGMPEGKGLDCYGGQFQKYEGLTCNITELVNSAGGQFLTKEGKPDVNSPDAIGAVKWLDDSFKDGTIPAAAKTWTEEPSREAFQSGKLIFLRNWPYVYKNASATDGSSKVNGKFAVAPLPGKDGPGVSTLGGHNMAITKTAKHPGTARDFIMWWTNEQGQRDQLLASSQAPTYTSLYDDPELQKKFPYLKTLKESIATAKPRPKAVKYSDVTLAIQDATYSTYSGSSPMAPKASFDKLQKQLEELTQN